MDDMVEQTKQKVKTIRIRTWTLTAMIAVALIFYLFINTIFKNSLNIIDFVFLVTIQVLVHCLYFPDGELSGTKDALFIKNKQAYNNNATKINTEHKQELLRKYCKYEYEQRKLRYIETMCSKINLSMEEFNKLKEKSEDEIKNLQEFTYYNDKKQVKINFNKKKRKMLYKLLFLPIPVEENQPETIMSALEYDARKSIHDESIGYKIKAYVKKFSIAILFGLFFAYIGFQLRDGITIADIFRIVMYLCTMFSTAVMSFSSGETCQKVYKKNYYVSLAVFIDGFFEWELKNEKK